MGGGEGGGGGGCGQVRGLLISNYLGFFRGGGGLEAYGMTCFCCCFKYIHVHIVTWCKKQGSIILPDVGWVGYMRVRGGGEVYSNRVVTL